MPPLPDINLSSFLMGAIVGYGTGYAFTVLQIWVTGNRGLSRFRARSHRPESAEERIDNASKVVTANWQKETVAEGMRQMKQYYKAEGVPCPTDKALRQEVETMLNESIQ